MCKSHINNELILWYDEPASKWEEALPIGNGRLGAMVYGGTSKEHIQFNEETLWAGEPHDYSHKGAYASLAVIRDLLWNGKQKEAEDLALEKFMSVPLRQQKYQPFGDILISFPGHESAVNYRRELNLETALSKIEYEVDGITFTRECLASFPDNLIAIQLTSSGKKSLTFDITLTALHEGFKALAKEDGTIQLDVRVKDGALFGTAIDILPALPDDLPSGSIKGIRARGGFELEFAWESGKLVSLKVTSKAGYPLSLRYGDKSFLSPTLKGQVLELDGNLQKK